MTRAEIYNEYRPLLFSIAYRMLGSVMAAEDIVQDAYLRWQEVDLDRVQSPKSYLSSIVTRLCIDHLRSAQVEREDYVGPWLPEPLVADRAPMEGPADNVARAESLSMAFLVLMESLSPKQRAVFLLHDVFDYTFAEVAEMVGEREANCRKLASRARTYIEERRPRFDPEPAQQEALMEQFWQACTQGDLSMLVSTLEADVTLWSDGGGKVAAARRPIHGADNVARFMLGILQKAPAEMVFERTTINGQPAIVGYVDGTPRSAVIFNMVDNAIAEMYIIVNPDKLAELPLAG